MMPDLLAQLGEFSTPSVLNGLKRLGMPTREFRSFAPPIRCMSPALGTMVGFAATRTVISGRDVLPAGRSLGLAEQIESVLRIPEPRVLVIRDLSETVGPVCALGDLSANINRALGCVGAITSGPVRDLPEMEKIGFRTFAAGVAVGGGSVKTVALGDPIEVGGVAVNPGELIHGDMHGAVIIPADYAPALPEAIRAHEAEERRIIEFVQRDGFTPKGLEAFWARRGEG